VKTKIALVLTALVLALIATGGTLIYLQSLRTEVVRGNETVRVLVAQKTVTPGTSVADMLNQDLIGFAQVPRRFMVSGAITDTRGIDQQVLTVALAKGEQVTDQKIRTAGGAGLSFRVPKGMVAATIAVDEATGVGGEIAAGDRVSLVATFSPGPGGVDATHVLLSNVEVLETSTGAQKSAGLGQSGATQKKTVTVAVSPTDSEKLVFAAEKGHLWVTLEPAGSGPPTAGAGRNMETIFR
jgi:pilus assembly protein CpaB